MKFLAAGHLAISASKREGEVAVVRASFSSVGEEVSVDTFTSGAILSQTVGRPVSPCSDRLFPGF